MAPLPHPPLPDPLAAALTERLVQGSEEALRDLYQACFDPLLAFVRHATGRDESFALDCVQDAWMRVAAAPVLCGSGDSLDAWLRRVALTAALDRLRADAARRMRELRWSRERPRENMPASEKRSLTAQSELMESLRAALESLPPDERSLLILRHVRRLTLPNLAALLGVGPAAVDSRLRRLAARVRDMIEAAPEAARDG